MSGVCQPIRDSAENSARDSEVFLAPHLEPFQQRCLLQTPGKSPPPSQSFRTPSRSQRLNLNIRLPNEESPASSNVPALDPGSSATSATTSPIPTSPSRLTPSTPLSNTRKRLKIIPDETMMRFLAPDEQEHSQFQDSEPDATYIENWLHHASFAAVSPYRPPSFCYTSPQALQQNILPRQYIYQSPESTLNTPKDSTSDFVCSGVDIKSFPRRPFDLDSMASMGVLEAIAGIQPPLASTKSESASGKMAEQYAQEVAKEGGLSYDPLCDGTPQDERILLHNMRDPWPYDQRRLVPVHLQSTSTRASAPYPDTFAKPPSRLSYLLRPTRKRLHRAPLQDHPPAVGSRATTSRIASCFGLNFNTKIGSLSFPLSSMKSKNKRGLDVGGGKVPNSMVPHPDWGTFAFRSDSDSLCSDDSDGDVHTWLRRVVRRNNRMGLESLKIATGNCRPTTIEEYERSGSWINERSPECHEWASMEQEYGKQAETINQFSPSSCTASPRSALSENVRRDIRSPSLCDERGAPLDRESGSSFGADSFCAPEFGRGSLRVHSLTSSDFPALPSLRPTQPQASASNPFVHASLSTHGGLPISTTISSASRNLRKAARKTFGPFVRRAAGTATTSFSMVSISLFSARRRNTMAGTEIIREKDASFSSGRARGHRPPGTQDPLQAMDAPHLPVVGRFTPTSHTSAYDGVAQPSYSSEFDPSATITEGPSSMSMRVATVSGLPPSPAGVSPNNLCQS